MTPEERATMLLGFANGIVRHVAESAARMALNTNLTQADHLHDLIIDCRAAAAEALANHEDIQPVVDRVDGVIHFHRRGA